MGWGRVERTSVMDQDWFRGGALGVESVVVVVVEPEGVVVEVGLRAALASLWADALARSIIVFLFSFLFFSFYFFYCALK